MRILPTHTDPFYTVKTQLDGVQYQFQFQWNHVTGTWFFDLYDANGGAVVQGVMVAPGVLMLRRSHYLNNCPPGEILCTTLDPVNDSPPGLVDLDLTPGTEGRCRVYYIPLLDLLMLGQANQPTPDMLAGGNG